MREKILEIIERENRNLNPIDIVNMLYKNSTVEDYRKVMDELDSLCRDGILRQTNGNAYKKNELITGVLDMHEKGNAHLLVKDGPDIFIAKNNMKGATDNDTVLVDYVNKEKNEGKVVRVLKRSLGRSLAEVVDIDGVYKIVPLDKELPYEVVVDTDNTDFSLVDGLIVHIDYVRDLSKGKVLAKIDRVIGHKNAPGNDTEITMIASEFGVSVQVPEDAKEEAKKFPKSLDPVEIEKEL